MMDAFTYIQQNGVTFWGISPMPGGGNSNYFRHDALSYAAFCKPEIFVKDSVLAKTDPLILKKEGEKSLVGYL